MKTPALEFCAVSKAYLGAPLLQQVSLRLEPAQTLCLLGPSGAGKSTLLRLAAGLETPDTGEIYWQGQSLRGVPAHRRQFGFMFQDYALFPHLDVFENVAFGLRLQRFSAAAVRERVDECLALVKMQAFARRRVEALSGGEQQRVALARALAPSPRLLMLDEPLGALDRALRETLLLELRTILRQMQIPALYVTHDQQEAFALADQVAVLNRGRMLQVGTPLEVFQNPASVWVARFLGLGNVLQASALVGQAAFAGFSPAQWLLLRYRAEQTSINPVVRGVVREVTLRGEAFRVILTDGLMFDLPAPPRAGQEIGLKMEVQPLCE